MSLEASQRWLQAAILHKGADAEAFTSPAVRSELNADVGKVIRPSATLNPAQRADIYREMYWLRMREALGVDYPCLRHFLGIDGFAELVDNYVERYPSSSYTLNRLGDRLPDYIAETSDLDQQPFLADLARFELAMTEVFDEAETPGLSPEQMAALPADSWADARLLPIAALRIVRFAHDIPAAHDAYKRNETITPVQRPSFTVIHRREYKIYRLDLDPAAFGLLQDLAAGSTLGGAIEKACLANSAVASDLLFDWFQQWVSERIFESTTL